MLHGLAAFLRWAERQPNYQPDRFAEVLRGPHASPVEILQTARQVAVQNGWAGAISGYTPFQIVFRDLYNNGLRRDGPNRLGPLRRTDDRLLPTAGSVNRRRRGAA
jgi:hypothetical protein